MNQSMTQSLTDSELKNRLHRILVHIKRRRFDEAALALDNLPPVMQTSAEATRLRIMMHSEAGEAAAAAAIAAEYPDWRETSAELVETAMHALQAVGQDLVALDLAHAIGPDISQRVERTATKMARRHVDRLLIELERIGAPALAGITEPMLDDERHRRMILRGIVLRMRRTDDLADMAAALTHVLSARPDLVRERIQLLAALRRLGEGERAAAVSRHFPSNVRLEPEVLVAQLQALLKGQKLEEAGALAEEALDREVRDPQLAKLVLMGLNKSGRSEQALQLVEQSVDILPPKELAEHFVRAASATGAHELAARAAQDALDSGIDTPVLRSAVARLDAEGANRESAEELYRANLADKPDDLNSMVRLGELLLVRGETAEAREVLERAAELAPGQRLIRILLARSHRIDGNHEAAAQSYIDAIERSPEDSNLLRQAAASLKQAGREEDALDTYNRSLALRENRMPETLEQGMRELDREIDNVTLPQGRLDWAWQFFRGQNSVSRQEWERRAKWGYLADRLLFDWLEVRSDRADEAMALFSELDHVESTISKLSDPQRGLILTTAHVGPLFAGPLAIELMGLKAKWLASTPSLGAMVFEEMLISTSDQTEAQVVRQTTRALDEGYAIGIAVDGAPNVTAPRIPFEAREITYSPFVSRMAFRRNLVSLYAAPRWNEGMLSIELFPLPDPEPEESESAFADRWRDAWLDRVRDEIGGEPENLRLSGGIWRHIG